jgi:outer membrane protein OmpA-like peptidoglycan-associated protein
MNRQMIQLTSSTLLACAILAGQTTVPQTDAPVFRVTTTARTAKAISYQQRNGSTTIDFRGTSLLPGARGEAKVESKQGYIEIEVEYDDLKPANLLGAEYLTYVLWAITPEGRASNLGEILLNGTKSKLNVTTELQVFGLIVTAEPYFAVSMPSDLVVMENVVRADTRGKVEEIDAKYELLQRGQYAKMTNPLSLSLDKKLPLELYEARNAVQIAKSFGAAQFANDSFVKAEKALADAEAYQARNAGKKPVTMSARQAVQTAEDARAIAVKRQEADALEAERQRAAERQIRADNAKNAAQAETDRVKRDAIAAAELAEAQARAAASEAERVKQGNELRLAKDALEAERLKLENTARLAAAQAEADRLKQANDAQAATAQAEVDRLKRASDAQIAAAQAEADRLRAENAAANAASLAARELLEKQKQQLEADKVALRADLLKQFNVILQTQDTARGLIVNMPDVLFDTGKFALRAAAREKLSRLAGIVSAHPGLKLAVEGHTDSVGKTDYNQDLSEKRSEAVREYLSQQGMAGTSLSGKGFGEDNPIASNLNAAGRQQNRRVEIVISGDMIGASIGGAAQ